jgi:pimeloyl-ACP methyl ester carboxylesterase
MSTQQRTDDTRFTELQSRMLQHYGADAASRFVTLADPPMTAHLLDAGSGAPVILLHGGDGEAVDWAPLIARLQDHVHVIAVDRPGFGLSDPFDYRHTNLRSHAASFVASLLDALGIGQATIIGGSMGGFFALATALAHPQRVSSLVLVGMPLGLARSAPLPLRIIANVPGLAKRWLKSVATIDGQHSQYRRMFSTDPTKLPELYFETRLAGMMRPGAQETWALLLNRICGWRGFKPEVVLTNEVASLSVRCLVIWPEHDMAPIEEGQETAARMPAGTLVSLDDVGHFPFLEVPDQTARLILDFLG